MRILLTYSVVLLIFSSCKKEVLRGEGNISIQDRSLAIEQGFHTIRVNGSTKVFIKAGSQKSLAIKGYDNLMSAFSTEVKNGTLIIGFKDDVNVRNDNIQVNITYPVISNVDLNGSCEADFQGKFPFTEEISATINGSSKIDYDGLEVDIAHFKINGSGKIDGGKVSTSEAHIFMSGSGETQITVADKLEVDISGSGKVYYRGNPVIETNISGSGKIIRLN